jgi:hypothetical protein
VTGLRCPNSGTQNTSLCPILSHVRPKPRTENTSLFPILRHVSPKYRTENTSLCPILRHVSPKSRTENMLNRHVSPTHSLVTNLSENNCNFHLLSHLVLWRDFFSDKIFSRPTCHHKIFTGVNQLRHEVNRSTPGVEPISTPLYSFKTWIRTTLPSDFLFEFCHRSSWPRVLYSSLYELS